MDQDPRAVQKLENLKHLNVSQELDISDWLRVAYMANTGSCAHSAWLMVVYIDCEALNESLNF